MLHPTPSHVAVHYIKAMLARPMCSLPPPSSLPAHSQATPKAPFKMQRCRGHNNKTTTLIFLAEASTKRKPFSGFLFSPLFLPPGLLILLDQAHLCEGELFVPSDAANICVGKAVCKHTSSMRGLVMGIETRAISILFGFFTGDVVQCSEKPALSAK